MSKVRIFALGGLDEDGKNMYVVENNDDIFVIECGLRYPNDENLGVEMIIPDFNYLVKNQKRIKGIFITHGHDDVMGALPDLCKQVKAPIYMAPLTARMFERMARREGIKDVQVHRVRRNSTFKIGSTEIRTFGTTQSIADGFGVAIRTEDGYVVYTSEFIVDYDVKNDAFKFDMMDVTELGQKGILALMAESVGSTREGHSSPHHRITNLIEPYFEDAKGRIIVTTYSQNLYRVIEVIEMAYKFNRKIMIYDDELRNLMKDMAALDYYRIPAGLDIAPQNFSNDMDNVVIICGGTGSTIFRKVHKIASREDELVQLRPTDTVIIASPAVPGTEREESSMEDDLYKETANVHAIDSKRTYSMHASIEDLKMMIYLLNPQYYIPVKGEYRQLISNANIALDMGYPANNIIVLGNGQAATIENGQLSKRFDEVESADVLVDGTENLDASGMVLKDRETLSTDGAIIVGVVVNHTTKEIIGGPDVQSRGVIYLKDADYIIKEIGNIMESVINQAAKDGTYDNLECRAAAREKIARYVMKETGKKPMILPAIVEINTKD
ncbi:ribonuclease J [Erysipelotrichaceae bacterium Oil+RF-744-GAM-WT-6]|jgi:ribonuclease J|uniref:Ribonuclease J n=1 Tax=Stecheria intestinalis TaxID=2606630 RepID=A0A7X2TFT3_9FIRM|nr:MULTISPECIES: ribonuclease J [Erysipelotrichaceae]MCI2154017.1 ribonuclease J [Solobacterium sp.]MDY3232927.1 ribonuclease J [Erysipelotrichaceae bacterium]MCI6746700.1 ribonuclease J [Anaerolactibacter massiliensis]MDD5882262.1 ribonuclease J [Stecheria intestinalis]MDD6365470.1 ribonuclease J [Stecheria intestinalis]